MIGGQRNAPFSSCFQISTNPVVSQTAQSLHRRKGLHPILLTPSQPTRGHLFENPPDAAPPKHLLWTNLPPPRAARYRAPGVSAPATIRAFSSAVQRRRRSGPVRTSMRWKPAFGSSLTSTITIARSPSPPAHRAYSRAQQKNGHTASLPPYRRTHALVLDARAPPLRGPIAPSVRIPMKSAACRTG